MPLKTALYQEHVNLGAKIVDFHGWYLPLHYGSQLQEHEAVRAHAGIFDVSHMTIVDISGPTTPSFLRMLLTNDIAHLQPGQALYTCMCQMDGGILDDLIVYYCHADHYRLVLNAATKHKDLEWIRQHIIPYNLSMQVRDDLAMVAIQGPQAIEKTRAILSEAQANAVAALAPFACIESEQVFLARTGYTGEDGLEIIATSDLIRPIWQAILQTGVQPCGLAARDTLRLEAGLLLYGQDMDETTTPLESGLGWTIAWEPPDRHFIGREALQAQKQRGLARKLVGLRLLDKGVMRTGQQVMKEGHPVGVITSGSFSPALHQSIALARISHSIQDEVTVEIRQKHYRAYIGKTRFINKGKAT